MAVETEIIDAQLASVAGETLLLLVHTACNVCVVLDPGLESAGLMVCGVVYVVSI